MESVGDCLGGRWFTVLVGGEEIVVGLGRISLGPVSFWAPGGGKLVDFFLLSSHWSKKDDPLVLGDGEADGAGELP